MPFAKLMDALTSLMGRRSTRRSKEAACLDDQQFCDYADFYWQFINSAVNTTQPADLPGHVDAFADYHKMLKKFIQSQPAIYDEVTKYDEVTEYEVPGHAKVEAWLSSTTQPRRNDTPTRVADTPSTVQFSDVHQWLDSHHNEEDGLHYACVDIVGEEQRRAINQSFESSSSSWEVTRKPRAPRSRLNSRASDWV